MNTPVERSATVGILRTVDGKDVRQRLKPPLSSRTSRPERI
jgi:hypothetical protein